MVNTLCEFYHNKNKFRGKKRREHDEYTCRGITGETSFTNQLSYFKKPFIGLTLYMPWCVTLAIERMAFPLGPT